MSGMHGGRGGLKGNWMAGHWRQGDPGVLGFWFPNWLTQQTSLYLSPREEITHCNIKTHLRWFCVTEAEERFPSLII